MSDRRFLVYIGSDHGGFSLKEHLVGYLSNKDYEVKDFGTHSTDAVDYPDVAFLVARAVAEATAAGRLVRGIMIDAVGVASSMVANRVPGIRSAPCWNEFSAHSAREHNDANMLTLGGRMLGTGLAERIVDEFLQTDFAGGRHARRVAKIHEVTGDGVAVGSNHRRS